MLLEELDDGTGFRRVGVFAFREVGDLLVKGDGRFVEREKRGF